MLARKPSERVENMSVAKPSSYLYPELIITTDWLEDHLQDATVRIFDCTTYLVAPDEQSAYTVVSGHEDYLNGHIPGAAYLDLQGELSLTESPFRFTLPPLDDLADRFARLGIDSHSKVVLYSRGTPQWATRIWWMLRAIGFDNAGILDGGWEAWESEKRAIETGNKTYPAGKLQAHHRSNLFTDKQGVLAATEASNACVINALSASLHAGHSKRYGRPGRIPGSINVPAASLRQTNSGKLIGAQDASALFARAGSTPDKHTVIYCGGGIAATLDAFILHQLGYEDISVYDHSLSEWANDTSVAMEQD